MIGCDCAVCRSENPKNRRFRPSVAVHNGDQTILVDTAPELRQQVIRSDVGQVVLLLFTHSHADHIFGLDDLRRFNDLSGGDIPVYGDANTLEDIRRIFPYIFMETQAGGGKPRLTLHEVPRSFQLCGLQIDSFYVLHGRLPVLAYRFNDFGYVTDVNHIPADAMEKLRNLELLILDAVRFDPHVTHFGLYQALEVVEELKPRQALFTHLSHHFDHDRVNADLPPGAALAYDGQVVEL